MGASWQAFYAHLCAASIIRAMPETEIPPLCGGIFIHAHFFKNLSAIFGKTRFYGFVGSRGGNQRLYGRSRA